MSLSRKTRLTTRGILLITAGLLLGISGFLIGSPELMAISLTLIVIPVNSWVLERLRAPLVDIAVRVNPDKIAAHSAIDLFLKVTGSNAGVWRIRFEPPHEFGEAVKLDPGETSLHVTAHHRGVFTLGKISAHRRDPLKLASTALTGVSTQKIIVYPYVTRLQNNTARLLSQRSQQRQQHVGAQPSFADATLRQYVAGDDLRRVHWTATARHGNLLVRSDAGTQTRVITLFIDNRKNPTHPARVERIISVAASGAVFLIDRGWKVNIQTITQAARLRTYRASSAANVLTELAHIPTVATLSSGQTVRPDSNDIALLIFTDVDLPTVASQTSGTASVRAPAISMGFTSQVDATSGIHSLHVTDADTIDEAWNRLARML